MTSREFRCTRVAWFLTDQYTPACASSSSLSIWCMTSITIRWSLCMESAFSSSIQIQTRCSSRSRPRICVPRHGQACRPLRHFRLPKRPPPPQHGEQEGAGQDKGECAGRNCRICWPVPHDVQHPWSQWKEHQEGQGREKEHREEAHPPRAVQRGPLRKADFSTWNGCSAVTATSHLWAAFEQGIALALRLQALDRRKWVGHTGLWAQRCNPCKLSSSTLCPRQDPIRWQLCVRGHKKKFLAGLVTERLSQWTVKDLTGSVARRRPPSSSPGWYRKRTPRPEGSFCSRRSKDGLEQWRRAFVSQIVPWWSQKAVCRGAESLLHSRPQRPRVSEPPTQTTTGVGGGGDSRTTEWFLGCPKCFEHFGISGGSAGTPSCYSLWVFCSLVFSRLQNWVRSCWVRHSFHLFRNLLVLHCLLSEGIDVQIDSASLLLVQRLAVPGIYHNGDRARR